MIEISSAGEIGGAILDSIALRSPSANDLVSKLCDLTCCGVLFALGLS